MEVPDESSADLLDFSSKVLENKELLPEDRDLSSKVDESEDLLPSDEECVDFSSNVLEDELLPEHLESKEFKLDFIEYLESNELEYLLFICLDSCMVEEISSTSTTVGRGSLDEEVAPDSVSCSPSAEDSGAPSSSPSLVGSSPSPLSASLADGPSRSSSDSASKKSKHSSASSMLRLALEQTLARRLGVWEA